MERFGFVGLPNAGKSTLYNALAGGGAEAAPYPFATTDANVGVAKVPDHRVEAVAAVSGSRQVVPAPIQFVDIGGLVEGASRGEGLGNRFLAGIREVDGIVYVLRSFADADVAGSTDVGGQLAVLEVELCLADLESVESRLDKRTKAAQADRSLADQAAALGEAAEHLAAGVPLYRAGLGERLALLRDEFLLTSKPAMAVVNVGEDGLDAADAAVEPVREVLGERAPVVPMCVQLEAEAAQLPADERAELLEGLGLGEGAIARFARAAYELLGLRTFFTTREKETRAWPFRVGATAGECAGLVHTDFERQFVRAEVIAWDDLVEIGSWAKARELGRLRVEGRGYEVADGDVLEIRHTA